MEATNPHGREKNPNVHQWMMDKQKGDKYLQWNTIQLNKRQTKF